MHGMSVGRYVLKIQGPVPFSGLIGIPGHLHTVSVSVFYLFLLLWKLTAEKFTSLRLKSVAGAVATWLVRSYPDRVVLGRALAGDIVLCSWPRHFTLTAPLSTQVYKWVPVNLMLGVTLRWTSIPSREE